MKKVKLFGKYDVLVMDYNEFWDVWMKGKRLYHFGFAYKEEVIKSRYAPGYVPDSYAFEGKMAGNWYELPYWRVTGLSGGRVQVQTKNGAKLVESSVTI